MRKRLVKVGLPLLVAIALVVGLPFLTSASSADAIFGPVNNMSSESTATAYAVATQSEVLPVPANGNGLALSWLANNDDNHLALDPSNNARQEHRMLLEFTLPGDGVFAAGEVEIRLPRAFFEDRDGNFIVGNIDSGAHGVDPHMLPHFYIPLPGPTDFDYTIDEANDEVVIANFRPVQGGTTHLSLTMDIRYSPWNVPNGFTNEFSALATFAASTGQTPIESNSLSLDLTTRVVRVDPEKRAMQAYPVWQQAWGARPAGTDDHFFVRYRIFELATTATTQPFTLHIQDTPLDSGKIVGWTQLNSSLSGIQFPTGQINLGNFWTLGNTADFNNHADRTWTSHVPWFQEVGQSNLHRIQDVIVAYPRTGQPDQLVRNTIQIVFTPVADSDSASTTYNREGSWVFNDSYLNYAGNHFAVNKWMNGNNLVLPNLLDFLAAGEPAVFNRFGLGGGTGFGNVFGLPDVHIGINGPMALAQVRAFDATNGGTQPFTTTLIDDHVYLRTSTGQHLLNPEDFRFTSVGIHHYVELIPFVSSTGGILDVQRVPDRDRSPISIYYKAQSGGGWQYFETFSFADQFFRHENLPDLDIYRIKAVHDNGRYVTLFSMSFEIQLNPTPRVLSLIQGQETVSVVNFAAMIVEDHAGNLLNVATEEHYATGWPSYLMTQDIVDYGHLVQRAENYVRIGRTSYRAESEKVIRSSGIVSDSANARVVFPYRLFAFQDIGSQGVSGQTSFPRPSDALLAELLSEQTEGVFYDLLPQGMIIDPASIVARDARGRIVDHVLMTEANWQDSGRTMVSIYVSATAGTNLRNNASMPSSLNDIMYLSGTGFSVDFDLFYPWANAAIFGMTDIRNIAAYQSRSGAFLNPITEGNPHTNANNTATVFNAQEQAQMANFPRTDAVNSAERNTKSMLHVANIDPATSDQVGFSKHVRAAADLDYVMETTLRPGTAY
ncbi:MAG: hypothetical protein FWD93_05640, partial [Coriobacteriia bacterium]|nr:hypothetical protein [Coriobacteriia bacterium]